jgi:PAS domain S-box-containing protein
MRLYAYTILTVGLTVLAVTAVLFLILELIIMIRYGSPDQGQSEFSSQVFLFTSLILLIFSFMGLATWLLKNVIIAPLQVLNRDLLEIGKSGSLSGRIDIKRDDEIGDLTHSINSMLASLEEAQLGRITSEQRLSRLIDLVEEGICLIGPDGLIWFANPMMASIFDTTTHDLTGMSICSVLSARIPDNSGDHEDSSLCMTPGQHEFHTRTKSGHDIWVRIATAPYPLDTGRTGHLCVITDITPFRTAERELLLSNKKLDLLGSMTRHDIVNQLTTIRGMLSLVKKKRTDHALDQFITCAEDASERINKHIEFSKEYQKAGIEEPRWQDIKTVCNLAYAMSRKKGLTFTVSGDSYEIYADQLLQKVFYNLIDNSIRHGKDLFYITISTQTEDSDLLIIYEDDGGGVPDAMKDRIFERGVGTGTGWGLFFAYEVLNLTGMSITETGTFGIGAKFVIRVPGGNFRPVITEGQDQNGGASPSLEDAGSPLL